MRRKSPVAKVFCAIDSFASWMTSEGLMLHSEKHSLSGVTAITTRRATRKIVAMFSTMREAVKPHLTLKKTPTLHQIYRYRWQIRHVRLRIIRRMEPVK